jgi:hypothetical protein
LPISGTRSIALRRFLGDLARNVDADAEERRHGALAHRHGSLHRLSPELQETRCVGERERLSCGERGVFAERMAGDELDLVIQREPLLALQDADDRHRDRHQRRLCVLR